MLEQKTGYHLLPSDTFDPISEALILATYFGAYYLIVECREPQFYKRCL